MINNLTWAQATNLWLIMFALGFGWNVGRAFATPFIRVVRRGAFRLLTRHLHGGRHEG